MNKLLFVLIAAFLFSCSGPAKEAPPADTTAAVATGTC